MDPRRKADSAPESPAVDGHSVPSTRQIQAAVAASLDSLCQTVKAEGWEVFLAEPGGGDLLFFTGTFDRLPALTERTRFSAGEGFPGIVAESGEALATQRLAQDPRFLRKSVTAAGVRSFVCFPLFRWGVDRSETFGTVHLFWTSKSAPIDRALRSLESQAGVLGLSIHAGLALAGDAVERALTRSQLWPDPMEAGLQSMRAFAGAQRVTLALDGETLRTRCYSAGRPLKIPPDQVRRYDYCLKHCSVMAGRHAAVVDGPQGMRPAGCPRAADGSGICLPLHVGNGRRGAVFLDIPKLPYPPTRELVPLLAMARALENQIPSAQSATSTAPKADSGELSPAAGPVDGAHESWIQGAPRLRVRCFGDLEVFLDDRPLPRAVFPRKKALCLLRILLLRGGATVDRDALIEQLWPGAEPSAGANRLHGVIHALRIVIEPFAKQQRWIFILQEDQSYYFNRKAPHDVDLFTFQRILAEDSQRGDSASRLWNLAQIYRGDLFADDPYLDYGAQARRQFRSEAVAAMLRLAEIERSAGQIERALRALARAYEIDPWREDALAALARRLHAVGRTSDAREYLRGYVERFRRDVGGTLSAEIRRAMAEVDLGTDLSPVL